MSGLESPGQARPLDGLTVIDAAWLLPGQFSAMILRDLGARVVKIELPGGDYSRTFDEYGWSTVNRGKEGLSLNLRSPAGRDVLLRLVSRADVLIEGFRPGVMDRLGVSYEVLAPLRPELIYCSISGYGQDGDQRLSPGHGLNYAGVAGMVGIADGSAMLTGMTSDLSGSLYATIAILAALRYRDQHGVGQHIDLAIADTTYALMTEQLAGGHPDANGQPHMSGAFGVFVGADGTRFTLAAVEDRFWAGLCTVVERPDWQTDSRYSDDAGRHRHSAEIRAQLVNIFALRPAEDWLRRLELARIPTGLVNELSEARRDPYAVSRDLVAWAEQPDVGTVAQVQFPARFSRIPRACVRPAPSRGEHTDALLAELGYNEVERGDLHQNGVV